MLQLRERQRAVLIEKLPDLANVAAGALIFGQFLGERPISPVIGLTGLGLWFVLTGFAMVLARKDKQ